MVEPFPDTRNHRKTIHESAGTFRRRPAKAHPRRPAHRAPARDLSTLTTRQRALVDFVAEFTRHTHRAPTLRDISDGTGVGSTHSIELVVRALVRLGVVTWEPSGARTVRLTGAR